MNVIWKRLNDQGKYWRHVYKSLLLLDYLIKNGAPEVVREVKVHLVEIQTLTQFAHIDEKDKDVGVSGMLHSNSYWCSSCFESSA